MHIPTFAASIIHMSLVVVAKKVTLDNALHLLCIEALLKIHNVTMLKREKSRLKYTLEVYKPMPSLMFLKKTSFLQVSI